MTAQPTRDQLLDMTEGLRVLGDRPELCDEVVDGLWAALDRAEHRIARLEAQSDIRGRAVVIYRERAREAEARIQAVEDVLAAWHVEPGESGLADDLLRALNA